VLMGHGGSQNKRSGHILSLGRRLVRHAGFAAAAIDAVRHGERLPEGMDYNKMREQERLNPTPPEVSTAEMVEDWKATLDALQALDDVGNGPVGYYGVSMGTRYGIPFIAREPRIKVAALGLMFSMYKSLVEDAKNVRCPVLFVQQLEDDSMTREGLLELFDAIGTKDKRLHSNPGGHTQMPADQFDAIERFLIDRLSNMNA